jgi:hypothetical protein
MEKKAMSTLQRIIGELDAYLSRPLRDAADPWEQEERRELVALLARLKGER